MGHRRDGTGGRRRVEYATTTLASLDVWPLVVVDFEASGLHRGSYPVEVGISRWGSPNDPVLTWSRVVRPVDAWRGTPWNARAQAMHGLTREDLERCEPVDRILSRVERMTTGATPFADRGAKHDARWMEALAKANGYGMPFRMADAALLHAVAGPAMSSWLLANPSPHRAGPDAQRLVRAFSYAFGSSPVHEEDMSRGWPGGYPENDLHRA